jgi:hypothetical protein
MRKRLLVIVAALVATTALSGCWALRESYWTKDKVKPGGGTTLKLGLFPTGDQEPAHFFFGFLYKGAGMQFGPAKFDATKQLGRTKRMVRDGALADAFVDYGICDELVPGLPVPPQVMFRTRNAVGSNTNKFIEATLRGRVSRGQADAGAAGIVVAGAWLDDGDTVPEDPVATDDAYECTGVATTAVVKRGTSFGAARLGALAP